MESAKQVMYRDLDSNTPHGGFLLDNGNMICGATGSIRKAKNNGKTWVILEVYPNWINLDESVLGDVCDDE